MRQTICSFILPNQVGSVSDLVQAPDGNFYGTVAGTSSSPVFRITPAGTLTNLRGLPGAGTDPQGGLVLATDGNLYGTTVSGGTYGLGTLFKVVPSQGYYQTIHSFNGSEGARPVYDLIQASDGFLYGVTMGGGWAFTNPSTIFRATTAGVVTALTNFIGAAPSDCVVQGPDGWLYGTTAVPASIYKVSTNGLFQTLAHFYDPPSPPLPGYGDRPMAGLTAGTDGYLYGTIGHPLAPFTTSNGSVFRMSTNGEITTLVSFAGTNGSNPMTRLLLARDGSFYGLTTGGGPNGIGTIFRVMTNGLLSTLADAEDASGGINTGPPPLTQGRDGNIYGTGVVGWGTPTNIIFRLLPPPTITAASWSSGKVTLTWHSFTNGAYRIAYKNTLDAPSWITQVSTINATGTSTSASDFPGIAPQRIYQVVLLP